MNKQANEDDAIWGTMTLALPQVTEWNIEGTGISESGTDLRAFLSELNVRGNGKPVTLSINLLMSLGNGGNKCVRTATWGNWVGALPGEAFETEF